MGNDGLAQAQAAVVARHMAVEQDLKSGLVQGRHGQVEQQAVLKTAAAQGDHV